MKFAHIADCHLGGWSQKELRDLNFESFKRALEKSVAEKVDFIIIAGDLFDSPYPPIDILKRTFEEFRKIKETRIPIFLIPGSHDYSATGKTFLDVLEKAGFCKNISIHEERDDKIILLPTIYNNVALYGYPGRRSGLEVNDVARIKIQDSPGLFKILVLHTTMKDAVNNPAIKSVDPNSLPDVDYVALGHLHLNYVRARRVYPGPTFPNNISELEELNHGSFYLFNNGFLSRERLNLKEVVTIPLEVKNASEVKNTLINEIEKTVIKDKIVILKLFGVIASGRISDIDFSELERYVKSLGAYCFLKNTSRLYSTESSVRSLAIDSEKLESQIIKSFVEEHPGKFNDLIPGLIRSLQISREEDEKNSNFEERLLSETKKVIGI